MLERSALQPDLARATRAATAFSGALLLCALFEAPLAAQYAATAALGLSMTQLRGAYPQRVLLMAVMIAVISGASFLGGLASGHLIGAIAGIGLLALLSGFWRHLSADYGPVVGIDSALLFLLALEGPRHGATASEMALWTALGGTGAALLQLGLWFFRPQHPLRHAVAEAWVAASDFYLAMIPGAGAPDGWTTKQRLLREALDRTAAALNAARSRSHPELIGHLEEMLHQGAHLAMQVAAFHTANDARLEEAGESAPRRAAREAVLKSLANLSRSVAITLITHRRRNLELTRARAQTCRHLLSVLLQEDGPTGGVAGTNPRAEVLGYQTHRLLASIQQQLGSIETALAPTVEHSEVPSPLPLHLPDLSRASMPSIAAWLNSVPFPDPALIRYALRMAPLSMLAVGIYLAWEIPRGYWMAFAVIVVLQPDYGATRQRALQRVTGTVAGALLASATLAVHLPGWLLGGLTSVTAFCFAYFLKRKYGLAVFFVTIMITLVAELHIPVHLEFTMGRLLSNLAGAAVALMASAWFWPSSERTRFPHLVAEAILSNEAYFARVAREFTIQGSFHRDIVQAKQQAERAGNRAAASLQRLLAEPGLGEAEEARAVSVVTCNDRVTRATSLLAVQLESGVVPDASDPAPVIAHIQGLLQAQARAMTEEGLLTPEMPAECDAGLSEVAHPLLTILTEVRALAFAVATKTKPS